MMMAPTEQVFLDNELAAYGEGETDIYTGNESITNTDLNLEAETEVDADADADAELEALIAADAKVAARAHAESESLWSSFKDAFKTWSEDV